MPGNTLEPHLRKAENGDFDQIVQIERLCFPSCPWDEGSLRRYECTVAEWKGRIVGFLVSREIAPASDSSEAEREILNLAVTPHSRRRGIGRALLKHELARGGTFFLEVRESGLPARKLYKSLGFRQIGVRKEYYEFPRESAIVLRLK
jgi:ribosomal-protein-alanine acetyltransferase